MSGQKGSALIMALIISVILMALGLAITMTSLGDFTMSEEFEGHDRALFIAEAGLADAQRILRGNDLTEAIAASTSVDLYASPGPTFYRDPVALLEARSIDYRHLPSSIGRISLAGLITPGNGTPVGNGRFITRISDNDDGDNDLLTDVDGEFYVRVAGIHPGPPQEMVRYGSIQKNGVVMVEALYERDMSLDVSSPFTVYGPNVLPSSNNLFDGNSFHLDGFDHSNMSVEEILRGGHNHRNDPAQAGLSVINDDLPGGDAAGTLQEVYDALSKNQKDNITGADDGPYGGEPALRDDTENVRNSGNDDATNIFNPYFMLTLIERISAAADVVYEDDASVDGNLGTEDDPKIVVAKGDLKIAGSGEGCGLLIVRGKLDYNGGFNYNGLIMVVGEGEVDTGGANKGIIGGIYISKLEEDANGNPVFGTPSFTLSGNTDFYFRGKSIMMALSLLPFKQIAWREITPEIAQ